MTKKVLIVDDSLDVVKMVGLMLQGQGYEILAAQSGAQALMKAQSDNPDVIILDVMMPGIDGYEVCRRLRADPATAHIPILMFTAKSTLGDKVAGFEAGADDYLTKPIRPADLIARLEAVLLRAGAKPSKEPPPLKAKVIGFIGAKGGVGTTTLAVNVAVALAEEVARGKQVILADMRSGLGAVAMQLGLNQGGLGRLMNQMATSLDQAAVTAQLQDYRGSIKVLSGLVEPPGVVTPLSRAHAEAIFQYLGALADYLVFDLGTGLTDGNKYLLSVCHYIVVTIEPQRMALNLAQVLLNEMSRSLEIPAQKIGLVMVNKAPSGATYTRDNISELLQHNLIAIVTPAPELVFQAGERAIPLVTMQPDSLAARQFRMVAEHLVS
jgi:CheY-like chemotaxis protein/MinD-like ATPase involved in chromosome partitioning or flagellar assembly